MEPVNNSSSVSTSPQRSSRLRDLYGMQSAPSEVTTWNGRRRTRRSSGSNGSNGSNGSIGTGSGFLLGVNTANLISPTGSPSITTRQIPIVRSTNVGFGHTIDMKEDENGNVINPTMEASTTSAAMLPSAAISSVVASPAKKLTLEEKIRRDRERLSQQGRARLEKKWKEKEEMRRREAAEKEEREAQAAIRIKDEKERQRTEFQRLKLLDEKRREEVSLFFFFFFFFFFSSSSSFFSFSSLTVTMAR
jgi:hypothetical protein